MSHLTPRTLSHPSFSRLLRRYASPSLHNPHLHRQRPSQTLSLNARNLTTCPHRLATKPTNPQSTSSKPPSSTAPSTFKPIQQQRATRKRGPFSTPAFLLFLLSGAGLWLYFRSEKARLDRLRVAEASKGVGRPKVGGSFTLTDHNGESFCDGDMKGGFSVVYFGFSHCPDICPEELDKLARILELVEGGRRGSISTSAFWPLASGGNSKEGGEREGKEGGKGGGRAPLLPLFITCDPARDTPAVLKAYLREFHPGILGLTGSWQQVKDVCKKYRVYFSTPEGVKPGEDYLVDHSIYFYVMDPEGDFVEAIGRQHSPERAAQIILEHMSDWEGGKRKRSD